MSRPIIPVNFDNDEELLEYVNKKGNRAEFIRYCIRKEKTYEGKSSRSDKDLDERIETIVMRCLENYKPVLIEENNEVEKADESLAAAASFFDED